MIVATRTLEDVHDACPACGHMVKVEPAAQAGETPCPGCGHVLWLAPRSTPVTLIALQPSDVTLEGLAVCFEELFRLAEGPGPASLLIDLQQLPHLTSLGLARLLVLNKKIQAAGGKLALCGLNRQLFELFKITKMENWFNIYNDEQEALRTF